MSHANPGDDLHEKHDAAHRQNHPLHPDADPAEPDSEEDLWYRSTLAIHNATCACLHPAKEGSETHIYFLDVQNIFAGRQQSLDVQHFLCISKQLFGLETNVLDIQKTFLGIRGESFRRQTGLDAQIIWTSNNQIAYARMSRCSQKY